MVYTFGFFLKTWLNSYPVLPKMSMMATKTNAQTKGIRPAISLHHAQIYFVCISVFPCVGLPELAGSRHRLSETLLRK